MVALPVEDRASRRSDLRGCADRDSAEGEQAVLVEGITAIRRSVVDVDDPIEVGGETTYEIRVLNQGSKAATNVQLAVGFRPRCGPWPPKAPRYNRSTAIAVSSRDCLAWPPRPT